MGLRDCHDVVCFFGVAVEAESQAVAQMVAAATEAVENPEEMLEAVQDTVVEMSEEVESTDLTGL